MAVEQVNLVFKLSRQAEVSIYLEGQVTQEGIDKLIEVLGLLKDTYPVDAEMQNKTCIKAEEE